MGTTLADRTYNTLVERLLNNGITPGEFLDRRALAEDLGVSVGPVAVALRRLVIDGFLQDLGRKGTLVKPIANETVLGTLIVREGLESQIARMVCGAPVRSEETALLSLAARADGQPVGSVEQWREEIRFHQALASISGCETLIKEHTRALLLSAFHALNLIIVNYGKAEPGAHNARLVRELMDQDPDRADRAIRRHVRGGKGPFAARMPPAQLS